MMLWSLIVTMNTHPGEIPLYWVYYNYFITYRDFILETKIIKERDIVLFVMLLNQKEVTTVVSVK